MSIDKNHSEQFKKYLSGEMTPPEANAFERKVLNDPFAQEALEGLEGQNPIQVFSDINDLQKQITAKSKKGFSWMKIAAVVTLLMVSSFTLWLVINQTENLPELAIQDESTDQEPDNLLRVDSIEKDQAELIAEAEVTPEPVAKKAKKDEVTEVDKIELAQVKVEEEEIKELMPIEVQLAEADVQVPELEETVTIPTEVALQGIVAGVQVSQSEVLKSDLAFIDTSTLEPNNILSETLVAQEISNEESTKKSLADDSSKRLVLRGQSSMARSNSSPEMTITGKVTDDSGEALPGVSVIIKGTTTGTQTDLDGSYMLPKLNDMTLIYSFVGFLSQEIEVGTRNTIDVAMGGATELQEVVVTGYGVSEQEIFPTYSSAKPTIGNREYNDYLKENLQYPEQAQIKEIEGTVTLELTISPSGKISNIDIKKGLGYGCDEEAIRLINEGPKWNPAERDGNKVEEKIKVRVKFKIDK